jgi:hypothetical protein
METGAEIADKEIQLCIPTSMGEEGVQVDRMFEYHWDDDITKTVHCSATLYVSYLGPAKCKTDLSNSFRSCCTTLYLE